MKLNGKSIHEGFTQKDIFSKETLLKYATKDNVPNKASVLRFLKYSVKPVCCTPAIKKDPITGETAYTGHYIYEDDVYLWNTMDIYLFEKYNIMLSDEFLEYVKSKRN